MRWLLILLPLLSLGCANLQPAEAPVHRWDQVHLFGVTALTFSPDGKRLASAGHRGDLALYDLATRERIAQAPGNGEPVRALQFLDGSLYSIDAHGITRWRATNLEKIAHRETPAVSGLVANDGALYSAHTDGGLRAWQRDLAPLGTVRAGDRLIAITGHGNRLAVATSAGEVKLYDRQLRWLRDMQTNGASAHDLHFSADGRRLFGGGWFKLLVWDVESGAAMSRAAEHNGLLTSLDVSRDNTRVATVGRHTDSAIRVWRADNLALERRLAAHELCGAMIRFSPDGKFIASASDDESIALFDLSRAPQR